jgi:hypothetical protein
VLGWVGFVIGWLGAGAYSLDKLLGIEWGTNVGLLLAASGALIGVVQLLVFWRRPSDAKSAGGE